MLSYIIAHAAIQPTTFVPEGVLSSYNLAVQDSRSTTSLRLNRQSTGDMLNLQYTLTKPAKGMYGAGPTMRVASTYWTHGETPSGLPLGITVSCIREETVAVRAGSYQEFAEASYHGQGFRQDKSRGRRAAEAEDAPQLAERLCRFTLAHAASLRLGADGTAAVGGASYPALKASGTNTRYIDLAAWAERNNLVVSTGQDGTVKSFTKGGQLWIIPLASVKIKKGSTWQNLPDLVMRKDGKFYVPVAALQ